MSNSDEPLKKHYKYETINGDEVIRDELDRLTRRRSRAIDEELLPETAPTEPEAVSESLTGLALSGGGIRSGALGLGVLHALHRSGLLPFFDYLSTVSGGGYAGAYITSAGSQNRKHADETSNRSASHDDTVPYGRLKAFHDGEGLSERMQQFIFGGHYLLRTRRFFNRHLMGLLSIWLITISGLSALAALAAYLFRELDQPVVRHFLGGIGFRTDVSRGFFPVTVLLVLWLVCWCISFFRASGNMARAQGRFAAKLMPVILVTFGICVAALLGNGEFGLEWLSSQNGVDIAGLFSSAEKFFQFAIYGVIGVGLLPFLNPAALIRSGASPKTTSDRVVFAVASRVLLFGLPFVMVSSFARENISSWTEHRFVPQAIQDAGVRGEIIHKLCADKKEPGSKSVDGSKPVDGDDAQPSVVADDQPDWNEFVALTRHEIAHWNDWQSAWAPFWTRFRAEAAKNKVDRLAPAEEAKAAAEQAEADLTREVENANKAKAAADEALVDVNSAVADAIIDGADNETVESVEVKLAREKLKSSENASERSKRQAETALLQKVQSAENAVDAEAAAKNAKPRIAEFLWAGLHTRICVDKGRPFDLSSLPTVDEKGDAESDRQLLGSVEAVLRQIHKESLKLQELHARADQNTAHYAPDTPHLIFYRLLSLVSIGPDYLQGAYRQNNLGKFVIRRQRLALLRSWLADHLSRILETTNLGDACDWSGTNDDSLLALVEQARQMSDRHSTGDEAAAGLTHFALPSVANWLS